MRELIFLDTETGGLDPETDPLVELTYAGLEDDPITLYFGVQEVSEFIDNLIGFTKRGIAGRQSDFFEVDKFVIRSDGATMVCSNPSFDMGFLQAAGIFNFHYRMLDIESYAMAKLRLDFVPSTKEIFDMLNERGYEITVPDHTSRADVLAIRDAYKILRNF